MMSQYWADEAGRLKAYIRANPFARKAILSAGLHALLISGLLFWSLVSCRVRAPRDVSPFDLQPGGQPGKVGGGGAAAVAHQEIVNKSEDGLKIVKEKPPKATPSTREKAHAPRKTQAPRKTYASKNVTPQVQPLSKNEIKNILGSALQSGGSGSAVAGAYGTGGGGKYDPLGWYYAMVRSAMYEAWQQPSALAGTRGLMTRALIRVRRDGRIIQRSLDRSSGNALMDASVMRAVKSVTQLRALPPGFGGDYKDITVDFQLTESVSEE